MAKFAWGIKVADPVPPVPPVFQSSGILGSDITGSANVPVPSEVVANDIILVCIFVRGTNGVSSSPSGFNSKQLIVCTGSEAHKVELFWKRATGSDSGTYDFTLTAAPTRSGWSARFSGCPVSGDPFGSPLNIANSNSSGLSQATPAVATLTPATDNCLIVFSGTNYNGGNVTTPSGFTHRIGSNSSLTLDTLSQTVATATGSVTATFESNSYGRTGLVGYLLPNVD